MRDKYSAGQAGALGPGAHAHHLTFVQIWDQVASEIDLQSLATELSQLRAGLKEQATEPDHDIAIGSVALAEKAAQEGDGAKALEYLAKGGRWAVDVATKIGTTMAASAIKSSLGI